jgi:nonsense-mediated mRNA decay protein 3
MLCTKVSTSVHLYDPASGRSVAVPTVEYWKYPFESICNRKHLSEWMVMNVEERGGADATVELARANEIGMTDASHFIRASATKIPLNCGDLLLCYDVNTINFCGIDEEEVKFGNLDVIPVRKTAGSGRSASNRGWVLKTLVKHNDDKEEAINNKMGDDDEVEDFKRELEDDPEMRKEINLYRKSNKSAAAAQEDSVVDLSELLEGLTLNDKEDTL